ncbi:MAG: hypothetical protein KAU20_05945 [Nanoarchaeota archaeon]|nr:hypothetical protein [Nanoarchaeota archaeon]
MLFKNKKGAIGEIVVLLLIIGAVYVISHYQDNVIIIENGVCRPSIVKTKSTEIIFINKDSVSYDITINGNPIRIEANAKKHLKFPKDYSSFECVLYPQIKGEIIIK